MTDAASLADRVRAGELRLHELEAHADADTATEARRLLVEEDTGASLDSVGNYGFPAEDAETAIENMVGTIQVPMGVAGPVTIDGGAASGEKYLPLATTEGALLASVNRGCSVINSAGGATARVLKSGMTRAPVFRVADVAEAEALVSWTRDNFEALKDAAEETTNHGELLDVTPYVVGNSVYLRFRYDTKDAMGMNMVTIATGAACDLVEEETTASLVALSGNLCTDKKPAAINAVEGRGRSVTADVRIPREVVEERLHTTPEAIAELNTRKNLIGSAKAASLGFNAHVANVVAAMFLATGQDEAQVVEGANAITTAEVQEGVSESGDSEAHRTESGGDLYVSVSIASLEVGTVGGGTKLPTQAEGLDILGVRGGGDPAGSNADALAEAIAVGSLAGELSLLSALASRHLSSAHADLGR
ncbi:hydroxymethylglutaryl-CoA reductase (NADPH) [Haloferax mediterranei ATCC 33500]|uniref:3-hydroxy-3-methylglutaryl coenzyme A reductase n=1 Tax=Haloferax mediterranei (strain ATCC 33500 / DSM 1411 / JCM 8866 / NBRC 14739 / NCIMB 2177 / R-4) TaxID=523841 RepID=I3R7S7_HALMT|nr:hydroxymethylglutaryl-CoA reductase (NADPH) [Haloferax mediterranei]AFK20287.1 hydroxymethylglutaryl-CoA reductase (NADPH) / 3-hydroxy-3-methylglutaryl-CoA reductase [Haloferax mediterranei ATCC 33500]AHZ23656.1 3-hydroxy-3-methylglutaryl-CoA reductase [Haloferax mediterranei ATCC 33500]ELZ99143.1 3-hydroxy-3-methylglutaryl-CoA reductase [Haloferax mediterranei ATCC 33500]MDX5986959.1 hydroxymethylglutaryl-CoA reductase (NADPH) [Haloferax mediterranei ATCC 33500]QCQ76277.1 hydroxymethylglut